MKRVHAQDANAVGQITATIANMLQFLDPNKNRSIVLLNIGVTHCTVDCLGPLVGSMLLEINPFLNVYGTMRNPISCNNFTRIMQQIQKKIENPLIIAVDACMGQKENVGTIAVRQEPILPGSAFFSESPICPIGEIGISGVVMEIPSESPTTPNVGLWRVVDLANCIAESLAAATREN